MRLHLVIAAITACSSSSPPPSSQPGEPVEVVVIAAGDVSVAPVLEALAETLPPGSEVTVIADPDLATSIDKAIARLEDSETQVRAVIAVGGGPAAAPDERIAAMRRAGILGYTIHIGSEDVAAFEQLGYTAARQIDTAADLRGVAGAIGATIGSR